MIFQAVLPSPRKGGTGWHTADFDPHRNGLTLVCEQEGILQGYVTTVCIPMLPLPGLGRTAWNIIELCVPGQETEINIGAALLQEVNRMATKQSGHVDVLL